MKHRLIAIALLAAVAGWGGCEKYTSGYDANPLLPTDADAPNNFSGAQLSYDLFTEGFPAFLAAIWSDQAHGAQRQFSAYDAYSVNAQDFGTDWSLAYTNVLANLRIVEQNPRTNSNLRGASLILEGLHMGTVAALWGDVPYSQAAQPERTSAPRYDPQLTVYDSVLAVLDRGIALLNAQPALLPADVFSYAGRAAQWIRLGHSAKARYLMQRARSMAYSGAILNAVITEGSAGIMATSGADDLLMPHGQAYNGNMNLWYSFLVNDRSGYMDAAGNFAYAMMKGRRFDGKSDEAKRTAYYFTADGSDLNYATGGAYAIAQSYPFFRASETHLLIAEAYARLSPGSVDASALTALNDARHYVNTVFGDSLKDFVSGDFPAPAALLQAIFNEEYLALMHQTEAWNFLRRVDYAVSYADSAGVRHALTPKQGTQFPQRFLYSVDEVNANPNTPAQSANSQFLKTAANR
jgi:hypothetical protein